MTQIAEKTGKEFELPFINFADETVPPKYAASFIESQNRLNSLNQGPRGGRRGMWKRAINMSKAVDVLSNPTAPQDAVETAYAVLQSANVSKRNVRPVHYVAMLPMKR
jgi:hypothetical protein